MASEVGRTEEDSASEELKNTEIGVQDLKLRYDWYQTESHVIISVLLKHYSVDDVNVIIEELFVDFSASLKDGGKTTLHFDLAFRVLPSQSLWKKLSSKVEIKLMKSGVAMWKSLERTSAIPESSHEIRQVSETLTTLHYPSSSIHQRDWDKIVSDITKMEEEETKSLTGDASVNKLFQDIYAGGSEDVQRAMNKSFMESGGTVLSTNWTDVGTSAVQMKPPEGMEFKKWDQ